MKIIFLDIDGVVLPVGTLQQTEVRELIRNPDMFVMAANVPKHIPVHLNALAHKTGASFVLISSWRHLFSSENLQHFLERLGLFEQFHTDWMAPMRLQDRSAKVRDMGEWVGNVGARQRDCIVIDDDDELDLSQLLPDVRHLKTISDVGFSRDDLDRGLKMLGLKDRREVVTATTERRKRT